MENKRIPDKYAINFDERAGGYINARKTLTTLEKISTDAWWAKLHVVSICYPILLGEAKTLLPK